MTPQAGDVLVSNPTATIEHRVSVVGEPTDETYPNLDAALAKAREFARARHVDAWLTEDHTQADGVATSSETDALTGLTNARGLFDRFDTELALSRRYREPLALLLVDLDGLKDINDRYGHRAGDEAIRSLAEVIRSQPRETDVRAPWGGDEFAILPRTSKVAALAFAGRIRALIPQHSAQWPSSGSVGVAWIDPTRTESWWMRPP